MKYDKPGWVGVFKSESAVGGSPGLRITAAASAPSEGPSGAK